EYRGGRHVQAYMALVQRAVRGSAHLLTFSDWSKRDIVQHLGLPPARITATLLAADDRYQAGTQRRTRSSQRFFEEGILEESSASSAHPVVKNLSASSAVNKRYGLESPFIYYVGGLDARKNVATLVRAFGLLRGQGYHHVTLAIAGKALGGDGRLFPDLDGLIAELGLTEAVRRINVPHEDGPLLYQAATIFAFPSRYEGFGLPPLEAMASGTPVVCSSSSSLPEVVGDAALLVEPDDVAGWAVALRRLLDDEQLREELRARGLARAAHFSYRRVAEETLAVYEAIDD
ncbi:MAG: glycosyltransferase family 4 protein, partial [Chloroflexaceae bacterium]|nr:glycosyltransferase family 4 protein [Chloroflexaceae bacterium]